ncbi:MAG TPA: UDP-glucose/GDP-mannose dehydrogenase family protein [Nitrospiria bacterium]|jgi:UDPglucose 6-dehydrogenase|nr:UDP-glucose/GDP-mannose dehydrogenase family protein [Nitrospiria bacterium]
MHIAVVGTGYVGLVTGACFAEFGVHVTCVDKDVEKIEALRKGQIPIYEPGLAEMVAKNRAGGRLDFTTDIAGAVRGALAVFIAVGTPPRGDGSANLAYVESVAETIARHLDSYKLIITKSTVPVGTGERLRKIIGKNLKEHLDFDIVSNPEFLREGSAIEDFLRPNRVVIGTNSPQAEAIMKNLYRPLYLIETPFIVTDVATAEMIKYASNAFLATKISFINEMANLCEKVGADVHQVAKGMGLDGRIGPKFLHPGPGFGGSCLPKDTLALVQMARQNECELELLNAVIRVNAKQKAVMVQKILQALGGADGKNLAVLGLAFKPNTDDIREAPAIEIIQTLVKAGVKIRAYDPAAMHEARKILKEIRYCEDPYDTAEDADAVVLITEWNEFRSLDLSRLRQSVRNPIFIDLRNVYDEQRMKQAGFRYVGVGRGREAI